MWAEEIFSHVFGRSINAGGECLTALIAQALRKDGLIEEGLSILASC